jgi:hypothetical protein
VNEIAFKDVGPPLTPEQVGEGRTLGRLEAHLTANRCLPADFRAFVLRHNGGDPDPRNFKWFYPAEGEVIAQVENILGLDPRPFDDPRRNVDCISTTLIHRGELPRYAVAVGFVDRDNLLLIFVDGEREGQVWIKVMNEILGAGAPGNPEAGVFFVAESFTKFLSILYRATDDELEENLRARCAWGQNNS